MVERSLSMREALGSMPRFSTFWSNPTASKILKIFNKMHHPGIEPGSHRWQRCILPLDQWCDQQGFCHCGVNNTVARRVSDRGSNLPTQNRQHLVGCRKLSLRDSIVVSISACHADDPGSIPGRGVFHCGPSAVRKRMTLAGLEPAIFGSEDRRLIH